MKNRNIILLIMTLVIGSAFADVYNPFVQSNKDKIDPYGLGYCKSNTEDLKLWIALNKYASSFLKEVPEIPPDQRRYIESEIRAGGERMVRMLSSPIYIMRELRDATVNIQILSDEYIATQSGLRLSKRVEFIGRVLLNLNVKGFDSEEIKATVKNLARKDYFVPEKTLLSNWMLSDALREVFINQLICFGENNQ